jgi:hypothetical protein
MSRVIWIYTFTGPSMDQVVWAMGGSMQRKLISLFFVMLMLALLSPQTSSALDRDIPLQMLSMRDRLLRDRTHLLNLRSDYNQRITYMQRMVTDIERIMYNPEIPRAQYDELAMARGRLLTAINETQRRLDAVEKGLIANNQDISNLDYNINRFAALTTPRLF